MSHFSVYVLVPNDVVEHGDELVQAAVGKLLAPYDENTEVPTYQKPCDCGEWKTRVRVQRQVLQELGFKNIEAVRDAFSAREDVKLLRKLADFAGTMLHDWVKAHEDEELSPAIRMVKDKHAGLEAEVDKLWGEFHVTPYEKREAELLALPENQEAMKRPDPECSSCGGRGSYPSQYNPKSQWDWWVIGGRWSGTVKGAPVISHNGFNFAERCRRLKDNLVPTEALLQVAATDPEEKKEPRVYWRPHALVTPDGEWHARGKMGWWGMSDEKFEKRVWEDKIKQLYAAHPAHHVVCVDCHI